MHMVTAIIPIILTVALGFALESRRSMDVRALSSVSIYVLLPCLVFHSLLTTELASSGQLEHVGCLVILVYALKEKKHGD